MAEIARRTGVVCKFSDCNSAFVWRSRVNSP